MPQLDETTLEKIAELRAISNNWSEELEVYELLKIDWLEGDAVWYACLQIDEVSSAELPEEVSPVECRIIPKDTPAHFFELEQTSSMGDEEINLEIWDGGFWNDATNEFEGEGDFADLVYDNGEGVRAEVYFWFPQVELLLSVWQGHLRTSEDSDAYIWKGKLANGFRSPNLPLPRRAHWQECQAVFGGLLETQEQIDENDCDFSLHVGGPVGTINPATGEPWTFCDRKNTTSCTLRGIDPLRHLSHRTQSVTTINNQTSGPQLYAISRGNETNLKKAVRVVMGTKRVRDMEILAFVRAYNNNTPDHGFFDAVYEGCEGPIKSFSSGGVTGPAGRKSASGIHYSYALGDMPQVAVSGVTPHPYSGTALFRLNYGWVNPGTCSPENMRGDAVVSGLKDIRVYTDENTYTKIFTDKRVWQIARMLCDKRWGYGMDYARLGITTWIETGEWADNYVTFTDPEGTTYGFYRGISDVELVERTTQQQIEDMCLAGRFSRPFQFQGKTSIAPLRALTEDELDACPTLTDEGDSRNIIFEKIGGVNRSTLRRSQKSDLDLPNRIESTFDDYQAEGKEQPAVAEDVSLQLRAGRVEGSSTRRVTTKKNALLGVTQKGQAVAVSYFILWFGAFGDGGMLNNLEIKFKIWFLDALDLHVEKVIKVTSSQLARYGFEYFKIKEMKRAGNLVYEIKAQAHNNDALADFDVVTVAPPPFDPPPDWEPCVLDFGTPSFADGNIVIPIEPC
jgi:hypothetical protein